MTAVVLEFPVKKTPLARKTSTATDIVPRRHGGRHIYETLRQQILSAQLKPGEPLDEISLAERFDLSRSPVRDALARLVSEGLVVSLPNRTTMVAPFEITEFPNYIAALDLMQRTVTRLAARNRTADDLARIEAANHYYLHTIDMGDLQGMTESNKNLHLEIARAAHNPYFLQYYERLLGESQRLFLLHFGHITEKLQDDHDEILQAIRAKDAETAERHAHEHTLLFRARFLEFMQQNLTKDIAVGM